MANFIQQQSRAGDGYISPQAPAGLGDMMGGMAGGMKQSAGGMHPMSAQDTANIDTSGAQGNNGFMQKLLAALRG